MFSTEPHTHFSKHPLAEVICQLRFPEILAISANPPVAFQEAIRAQYPQYQKKQEIPAAKAPAPGGKIAIEKGDVTINHQFSTADGIWRVNLTGKFISLTAAKYTCWEDFAGRLDSVLASFISVYQPSFFERIGLRYLNFISRKYLGLEGVPFSY